MKLGKVHSKSLHARDQELAIELGQAFVMIIGGLLQSGSPEEYLKWAKNNAGNIAIGISSSVGAYAGAIGAMSLWAGGLTKWGAFCYWAGVIAPPVWVPVIGAGLGALAIAAVGKGSQFLLSSSKSDVATLAYSVLLLMMNADGKVSEEEKRFMNDFLAKLELDQDKKEKLSKIKISSVDDLLIPSDLPRENAEKILKGVWGLALSDGLVASEVQMFEKISYKLNVDSAKQKTLKLEAESEIKLLQDSLVRVINLTNILSPKIQKEQADKLLAFIASIDPVKDAKERLSANINKTIGVAGIGAALGGMDPLTLAKVMSSGYSAAKILLSDDPGEMKIVNEQYEMICKKLPERERLLALRTSADKTIEDIEAKLKN